MAHASGWVSQCCLTKHAAFVMLGQSLRVRTGLVMLPRSSWCPQDSSGGMGWQQSGSSIVPPHRQGRNLSKIRHDGGEGHMKFRGSSQKKKML